MTRTRNRRTTFRPRLAALEARACPSCTASFDPLTHVLTITGTPASDVCTVSTLNGEIQLDYQTIPTPVTPTVNNTDLIQIQTGDSNDLITIDLGGGVFAPGATPEASGLSEIEFEIDSGATSQDNFILRGTLGNDDFSFGLRNGLAQVNLDADDDVDIVANAAPLEFRAYGSRGDDRISAAGDPVVGDPFQAIGLFGEGDNDILIGGEGIFNTFVGGPGDDLMIGGKTLDRYFFTGGGLGSDTIIDLSDGNNDTLIFTDTDGSGIGDFIGPVNVNLSLTALQVVNPGNLTLTLAVQDCVDHVIGSIYDDVITGNAWGNILFGGFNLNGQSGNDILTGLAGNDILHGNEGDDILDGSTGNDVLDCGDGNDVGFGGSGDDQIDGGTGDDLLFGDTLLSVGNEGGDDVIHGGAGNDELHGQGGNDDLSGDAGTDALFGEAGFDHLDGGAGDDALSGGTSGDVLLGQAGDDQLSGQGGRDELDGGPGVDLLHGGLDNDLVAGGDGDDQLFGDAGADALHGDGDDDQLYGGPGPDQLDGDAGHDLLHGDGENDVLRGGTGDDLLYGDPGNDLLFGQTGDDILHGGANDDILFGDVGDDQLFGDTGNDNLNGGDGADELHGGQGNDIVNGGGMDGALDLLKGDIGQDVFYFWGGLELLLSDFSGSDVLGGFSPVP
jgi:Ca2+-binding RTX toxin-like protein